MIILSQRLPRKMEESYGQSQGIKEISRVEKYN